MLEGTREAAFDVVVAEALDLLEHPLGSEHPWGELGPLRSKLDPRNWGRGSRWKNPVFAHSG
jgi:hypothetical protein